MPNCTTLVDFPQRSGDMSSLWKKVGDDNREGTRGANAASREAKQPHLNCYWLKAAQIMPKLEKVQLSSVT